MNWPSTVLSASGLISPRLSFPKAPWSLPFVNIFEQQQLKTEFLRGWASSEVPGPVLIVEFHFSSLEGLMVKLKLQYFGHIMAKWEELTHLRRPWCWERLRAGGEGDDRGWDGWMASPTQWTWVWVNSGSWWWPGRPGMLQFMGSQRVGHDWATELNCLIIPIPMITVSLLLLTNSSVDFVLHYFQFLCMSSDLFVCCTCYVSVSFIFSLLQV